MKRENLKAEKRIISGKKVKQLRREGILPANVYGNAIESQQVQLPLKEFKTIFKIVHETGLVDLELDGKTHPVLIHNVQVHPMTYEPIHADFFQVNMKEKVKTSIPIVGIGEPKAVTDKLGVLLQTLSEVEIEALPADLPENIEVDVEHLANVDDSILLEQIKIPTEVTLLTDASQTVFRIGELVSQEAEELAAEEEAAAEEAAEEGAATEEGEKAKEGETEEKAAEGETKEEKSEEAPKE